MSEPEIDEKLAESLSTTESASTNGTGHHKVVAHESHRSTKQPAPRGLFQKIFHELAKIFNGLHWAIGMTTLPNTASPREERSFVLMWLGIIVFMILFLAGFVYFLGTM